MLQIVRRQGRPSTASSFQGSPHTASLMFRSSRAQKLPNKILLEGSKGTYCSGSIAVLPDGDTVVTVDYSSLSMHVHSLADGKRLRTLKGSKYGTARVVVLGQDIVLSTQHSSSICVWRVSTGQLLHRTKCGDILNFVVAVCADAVVFGYEDGMLAEMTWTGSALLPSEREVAAGGDGHSGCILDIVAAHTRFATSSKDGTVKVWDVRSFRCVATLNASLSVLSREIDLNEKWLAITSSKPEGICVYDTDKFQERCFITHSSHASPRDVELSDDNEHLLAGFHKELKVFKVASGQILWSKKARSVFRMATCEGGRILVVPFKKWAEVWYPPPDVAAQIAPSQQLVPNAAILPGPLPPLQDALASVLAATSTAASHCRHLVTAEKCSASVAEWHSAHQLLMFAIRDADLSKSIDYEGQKSWWFDQIYITARTFSLSAEDETIVRNCLREAKQMGVIEGEQVILTSLKIAEDMRTELRTIHTACVSLCSRVLEIEEVGARLKQSYESYLKTQRVSQLIGIGLQLVPFFGGVAAGVMSVGAEVTSGLEVKDIVEAGIGLGVKAGEGNVVSFAERVLSKLSSILSEEEVSKLDRDHRERLEGLVTECGFSLEDLRLPLQKAHAKATQELIVVSGVSVDPKGTNGGRAGRGERDMNGVSSCEIVELPEGADQDSNRVVVHGTHSWAFARAQEQAVSPQANEFFAEHKNYTLGDRRMAKQLEWGQWQQAVGTKHELQQSMGQEQSLSHESGLEQLTKRVKHLELARNHSRRQNQEQTNALQEQVQALREQVQALRQENTERKNLS